jgi:predicted amidohydrolase YtcJ
LTKKRVLLNILIAVFCLGIVANIRYGLIRFNDSIALINGKIYTVDKNHSWAEAVVVHQGKIVFIGDTQKAQEHIRFYTKVIDLKGKLVLPGIHDTHLHPVDVGSARVTCLLENEDSIAQMLEKIIVCEKQNTKYEWLLGGGFNIVTLLTSKESPRLLLDKISRTRPITIMDSMGHAVWLNSAALKKANIDETTPQPKSGAIIKFKGKELDGILVDSIADEVFNMAYEEMPGLDNDNYEAILYALEETAKNGITSFVDARVYWKRNTQDAWKRVLRENLLTARVVLSLWAYPLENDEQQIKKLKSLYWNDKRSLLRINQIKLYSDGVTNNATAKIFKPYLIFFEEVGPNGLNYFDETRMTNYLQELQKIGFDFHIHAIGDQAVHETLSAIQVSKMKDTNSDTRFRITHVEMLATEDIPLFSSLDITADFQVAGDFIKYKEAYDMESLIGKRAQNMYRVRDVFNSQARITFSSDWDVNDLSPFIGMQNALTHPTQGLPDLDAVIRAYTINGAHTMRQEESTGSIELGKWGDLIVTNQNIFNTKVEEIAKTKVLYTILGGKVIYQNP